MDHIKQMAAVAAIDKMFHDGYFSISVIDKVAEMIGVSCKQLDEYRVLATLHCVPFASMPPSLQREIPMLMKRCLCHTAGFQFSTEGKEEHTPMR